jgi:hypothetical protein
VKLKEVHVDRYGPLRETLQFDDAHVVYGPNESGKTLLVESLLLSLTGDRSVAGARVDESPEGYVALNGDGEVERLDEEETLLDRYRRRNPTPQSGACRVCSLVFSGHLGNRYACTPNHPRFWRLPGRVVPGYISRARRSRPGPSRLGLACTP